MDSQSTNDLFNLNADVHVDPIDVWTVSLPFTLFVSNIVLRLKKTDC